MPTSSLARRPISEDVNEARKNLWLTMPKIVGGSDGWGVGADVPRVLYRKYGERIHNDHLFRRAVEDDIEAIFLREKLEWPRYLSIGWREKGPTFDTDGDACGIGYFYGSDGITDHNVDDWGQASVLFIALTSYLRRLYTAFGALENPLADNLNDPNRPAEKFVGSSRSIKVGKKDALYGTDQPREPLEYYGLAADTVGLETLGGFIPCMRRGNNEYTIRAMLSATEDETPGKRFRTQGFMNFYEGVLKRMFEGRFSREGASPRSLEISYGDQGFAFSIDDEAVLHPIRYDNERYGDRILYTSEGITTLAQASILLVSLSLYLQYANLDKTDKTDEKDLKDSCLAMIRL